MTDAVRSHGNQKSERPSLQFSVMCDGVATPQQTGNKPVFIGVFAALVRTTTVPQFFIANRWINGLGEHTQTLRILDPELKEVARVADYKFILSSKVQSADIYSGFVNINFGKPGVYWIRIELDGKLALSYPLPVFEAKAQHQVQAPPAPQHVEKQ